MPKNANPPPESGPSASSEAPASFESALAELERLVGKMESGSLTLEQSLASHRRGLELARFCQERLAQAEQQVKILEDDMLKAFPADRETDAGDDD